MPSCPWPLGPLGQLSSGAATPRETAALFDWLRDALTPGLQLPEICDKHTARPVQRYWFGWPTAMLLSVFLEAVCGVSLGKQVVVAPRIPEGWDGFQSPVMTIRGHEVLVSVRNGRIWIAMDGRQIEADPPFVIP